MLSFSSGYTNKINQKNFDLLNKNKANDFIKSTRLQRERKEKLEKNKKDFNYTVENIEKDVDLGLGVLNNKSKLIPLPNLNEPLFIEKNTCKKNREKSDKIVIDASKLSRKKFSEVPQSENEKADCLSDL